MLESWSADARRVGPLAADEARRLGQDRVGTEHLLLALLVDDGPVGDLLRAAGASHAAARHKVAEVQPGTASPAASATLPYTPRAQRALDRAGRFSRQERAAEVTARHVLLGVLDVEGLACQVLRGLGVDVVQLRKGVVGATAEPGPVADEEPAGAVAARPSCRRCGALLDDTLSETAMLARSDDDHPTIVSVIFCGSCGEALGAVGRASE